jgi:hypothetical protein
MNVKELKECLSQFSDEMPVKLLSPSCTSYIALTEDNIIIAPNPAHINKDAPAEEWDTENGKIEPDTGLFLLLNPIVT